MFSENSIRVTAFVVGGVVLAVLIGWLSANIDGCGDKKEVVARPAKDYVLVAIEGDVDNFNPLFAEDVTAGEINDLLFPGLLDAKFDTASGTLRYLPSLATRWEFENGNRDVTFHLRSGVKWSDNVAVTAQDVQLSYKLYGDTGVASVRQTSVDGLLKTKGGLFDPQRAVEVIDDSTVRFHFSRPYSGQLFDAGLPILPIHQYGKYRRSELRHADINRQPLSSGPFLFSSWKPMQEIVLATNPASVLPHPAKTSKLIFRVIPDYQTRLLQFRKGEIDVLPYINAADAIDLIKHHPEFVITQMGERFYDAINWNNIDGDAYASSKGKRIVPHPLFGSVNVRRALTIAINRAEILDAYVRPFGRECFAPISPIFKWAYNDTLGPLPYEPDIAKKLLLAEGWRDANGDGILEQRGRKFAFTLKVPSGNELRTAIAAVVQSKLREIGIDVKIELVERAAFWESVMEKRFDACIAGFSVPLQMQLDELWGSNLQRSRFNLTSFRNERIDAILAGAKTVTSDSAYAAQWKEFQYIIRSQQPCTFLYWMNDLVAINKRLEGTDVGILGITRHAERWQIHESVAEGSR